jgi:hypothetical protein
VWRTPWSRVLLQKLSHSATQEIPRLLWNSKFHYRVHNSPPLVPFPSQLHPVQTFPPCFPKFHSNIILPCKHRSCEWSLPFWFSHQNIWLLWLQIMNIKTHERWRIAQNAIWKHHVVYNSDSVFLFFFCIWKCSKFLLSLAGVGEPSDTSRFVPGSVRYENCSALSYSIISVSTSIIQWRSCWPSHCSRLTHISASCLSCLSLSLISISLVLWGSCEVVHCIHSGIYSLLVSTVCFSFCSKYLKTYRLKVNLPLVKVDLSPGWRYLRTECWGKCLDIR